MMEMDACLSRYIVKLHTVRVCEVRTMAERLSWRLLLLLAGAQAISNQAGGEIAGSKKQHYYGCQEPGPGQGAKLSHYGTDSITRVSLAELWSESQNNS